LENFADRATEQRELVSRERVEGAQKSAAPASANKQDVPPFSKNPFTARRSDGVEAGTARANSAKLASVTGLTEF